MTSLSNKTIFITGSTRGIGREIALKCAVDGANVVITGKTSKPHPSLPGTLDSVAQEVIDAGGQALPLQLDVRDDKAIQQAIEEAAKHFGGLDILVNNASAISLTNTLNTPMRRFDLMMGVNARATFACSQAAIPFLKQADNPHILNLAPPLKMESKWFKDFVAYTYSKFGMSVCTLGMSAELKGDGIAVNSLWPKTTIDTAAVRVHFPPEILRASRHPAIVADAAYAILTSNSRDNTGHFYIDEEVLRNTGVTDFTHYSVDASVEPFCDLYVE
ncbi:MAG: short chain dehydrogenase [Coxiellaceae bacterium]|nr:short chain dehydrogenase [Coxiellaceae bacterium]